MGLSYAPVGFLTVRARFATAFRAPSIAERFGGPSERFDGVADPCSSAPGVGRLDDPTVAARCAAEGLADGVLDFRTQLPRILASNPDLEPETAETLTVGLALAGGPIEGLRASLDYYDVALDGGARTLGGQVILRACYTAPSRSLCELIQRDAQGLVTGIDDRVLAVDGPLGHTRLRLGVNNLTDAAPPFVATRVQTQSDASLYDYVGRFVHAQLAQRF